MKELVYAFEQLVTRNSERDKRMREVALVRAGNAEQVFPGLFPSGNWSRPIVANLIDVVARDVAEQVGVLPTITAAGDSSLDDNQRTKADKRTKICNYYVASSRLGTELLRGADQLSTYGFVVLRVEPNFKDKRPHIHVENSMGAYYDQDRFGNINTYARVYKRKAGDVAAQFPEHADAILAKNSFTRSGDENSLISVVRWMDKKKTVMFILDRGGLVLAETPNKLGEVPVAVAQRPSLDGESRGQFDDVLPVYAAKARLALLTMQAVQKSVEAPLALPNDVTQLSVGPDAVIRSNSPEKIRRVNLDVPQFAFAENNVLADEMKLGTRFPQARAGQSEGSVVTGQGVKALMAGYDSQIKIYQSILGEAIGQAISFALATDEIYFPELQREVSATANGVPYKLKYKPSVDVKGNYGVTVEYGLMAGLDPNRALVWGLQARGDKLISRGMLRRNLPISINAGEEERAIDIEELRDSMKSSISGLANAIPQMVMQGQDPMKIVSAMASVIDSRKAGIPLEDAVAKAFKPEEPKPEPTAPGMPAEAPQEPMPAEQGMGGPMPEMPQGRPAMQELLAGLTGGGNPNLSARVTRSIPA
jgi:hypothetical protein